MNGSLSLPSIADLKVQARRLRAKLETDGTATLATNAGAISKPSKPNYADGPFYRIHRRNNGEQEQMTATTTMPDNGITDAERLMLYQDQLDNIRDLKANQWRISHYGVVAQAAYVATTKLVEASGCATFAISALAVVTFFGTIWLNDRFQLRIGMRREALDILSKRPETTFDLVREDLRKKRRLTCSDECKSYRRGEFTERWEGEMQVLIPIVAVQAVAICIAFSPRYLPHCKPTRTLA